MRSAWRQIAVGFAALVLSGCATGSDTSLGQVGTVQGFLGGAVADEPRAALVGRDMLSAGGTAADAATAMYFTLAVTLPSAAGLGGGGTCVVYDHAGNRAEALDFVAPAPAAMPAGTARPNAVPANARGFFALHAKYGRLRWSQLVAPAETLARFGAPVARALSQDLAAVGEALIADPEARRIFASPREGRPLGEGETLIQLDLAVILSRLRDVGPGDFYDGATARRLVEAVGRAGGALALSDLRDFMPRWRATIALKFGNRTLHFAPPPAAAGALEAVMWSLLTADDAYEDASEDQRPHLFAEMGLRAYADRGRWLAADGKATMAADQVVAPERLRALAATFTPGRHVAAETLDPAPVERPENPSASSFVAVDREGSAVACTVTMNNSFGTGRVAPGTGIVPAMMPGPTGRGPISLGPMVVVNHNVKVFYFAAAASGGVAAPTALVKVALDTLVLDRPLEATLAAPRLHHGGAPDLVYYEPDYDRTRLNELIARGHRVGATPVLGRVAAILCTDGIPPKPESCAARSDPRGFGLGASADR